MCRLVIKAGRKTPSVAAAAAAAHQLPLQLHWILPGQAGGAVAASLAARVGLDDFIIMHGADSRLHGRHQALHAQVLNAVGPCRDGASACWTVQN